MRNNINNKITAQPKAKAAESTSEDYKDKYIKALEENLRLREELEKYRKN